MSYPLSGIKVLDLSRVLAGPFAGRMLSDLGAYVVKLEPPEGDVTRHWGRQARRHLWLLSPAERWKTEYCRRLKTCKRAADC